MDYLKPEKWPTSRGILAGILLMAVLTLSVSGAEPPTRAKNPYDLMAGFIKNFPAHVDWPVATNTITTNKPVWRIGVLGQDPFDGALTVAVKNRKVKGRSFEIYHAASLNELPPCDIVYLASDDPEVLKDQLGQLKSKPVLTVGVADDFLKLGGIVQMNIGTRMKFDVNVDHARESGLKISAQMLVGARQVIQDGKIIK